MKEYKSYIKRTLNTEDYSPKEIILEKYKTSCIYMKIQDPIEKICKRITDKPHKFVMAEEGTVDSKPFVVRGIDINVDYKDITGVVVLQDKDTQQKFVFKDGWCIFPTFLNTTESGLLFYIAQDWYKDYRNKVNRKALSREQRKKDKFRSEMIDLYKNL